MSFTTGTAQRRGQQSASIGTSLQHVSQTPYPSTDLLRQPEGQFRSTTKRRRTASIGDDGATGLVIHGSHDINTMEGIDPDSATPPISGNTLSNPDFPISYTGRGTMRFVSPIRIATVDGPLNVNGDVYSTSGKLEAVVEVADWTISVGETGAGNDFTIDATNSYATYIRVKDNVTLHIHYTWTSKGSVADGNPIFIKGLPYVVEAQVHKHVYHATGITPTALNSYFVLEAGQGGTEIGLYTADAGTGTEVVISGAECAAAGTISIALDYHAVVP